MRDDLDKSLCKTFPDLYRNRYAPMTETCMCWGFPGDGWFKIIFNLSRAIQDEIADKHLDKDLFYADQVKEKFGTLRFYLSQSTPEIDSLITRAEKESETTCELCGSPGKLITSGWFRVRCVRCRNKEEQDKHV